MFEYSGASLCAGREQLCARHQVQAMQILSPCGHICPNMVHVVGTCLVLRKCRAPHQHLGHASKLKWPGGLTLKAMPKCFRIPCAKKTFTLPTAFLLSYNMLPRGSDFVGESSHIDLSFSKGGTALLQKVAPENWFQCMNVVLGVDESCVKKYG